MALFVFAGVSILFWGIMIYMLTPSTKEVKVRRRRTPPPLPTKGSCDSGD